MSNDNRKSPFSDTTEGDEEDWDKALNAWELPGDAAPKDKDKAPPAPLPKAAKPALPVAPKPLPTITSPPKKPVPQPPRPAGSQSPVGDFQGSSSLPPRSVRIDNPPKATPDLMDEDEDEATIVARVSPELLADSSRNPKLRDPGQRSAGLGQVFGRSPPLTPIPEANDALLEMLFDDPRTAKQALEPPQRSHDASVVTSAPEFEPDTRGSIPDDERKRGSIQPADDAPEGVLLDPFSPARDERSPTLRPGAAGSEETPATPAASPATAPPAARIAPPPPPPPRVVRTPPHAEPTPSATPVLDRHADLGPAPGEASPAEIHLESVPPDSMPPPELLESLEELGPAEPSLEELASGELSPVELTPGELTPGQLTLQGGHGLPDVGYVPAHSLETLPAPADGEDEDSDEESELPTQTALQTLDDLDSDGPDILDDPEQLEKWQRRARFLEEEAHAAVDRGVKARGLLVASELFALAGDEAHSNELAAEARELSPAHPLTHRQARALSVRDGDWTAVTQALQGEGRSAATPAARVHGAIFSAEIARVALGDKELAQKRLEQAIRAAPGDVRGYVNRLAAAIGDSEPIPRIRWPEGVDLAPLVEAANTLSRWRGTSDKSSVYANPIDALIRARASVRARDPGFALVALESLADSAGLSEGAGWLTAAVALAHGGSDDSATGRLAALSVGAHAAIARRAMVARALEKGDGDGALAAMADAPEGALSAEDRAVIGTLAHANPQTLEKWLEPLDQRPEVALLAATIRSALGDPPSGNEARAGAPLATPAVHLARLLAAHAGPEDLSRALGLLEEAHPGSALGRVLKAEVQIETRQLEALGESLAKVDGQGEDGVKRDRSLLAALVFELADNSARARELYAVALEADAQCEAAARAKIAVSAPNERASLLEAYAAGVEDPRASALVLLEAAHGGGDGGDPESYSRLLGQANEKAPSLPFAAWLAERRARARGEFDTIVEWLRERREASEDRVEQSYDLVREALLVADRDLEAAKELLEQASLARPADLALRELYERLSPEPPADRAAYWAERALAATGTDRARLALFAAFEYERSGNFADAARLAHASLEAEDGALARIAAARNDAKTGQTANLVAQLTLQSESGDDVHHRVEALEKLAELDEMSKPDASGALALHRAILELRPDHLPSLARVEQWLIGDGKEDDLEPIAAGLAKALQGSEAAAHAYLATRLGTKSGPWQSGFSTVKVAYEQADPPLWALREMEAHAALANDAATELAVARALIEQTTRPQEIATLSLRAADAAARTGDQTLARELLVKASNLYPTHMMVHRALAELAERTSDFAGAADAWEAVATLSSVPTHRLEASHQAAILWLDHVRDAARGRAALETAAQIDVTHRDVFPRLQAIYVAAADREALATLLESRLASVQDPNERIELEVVRGRTLAEIGDAPAAKRALSFALEASPDHPDALAAFADLSLAERDWNGAEQALIRLARLVPDTAKRAAIYTQLGALYDEHLPNPDRAELAYREVLRCVPGDEAAQERLVDVYRRMGDAPRALEVQQALLGAAKSPDVKRKRTIELAIIHEQVARDPKKAEALLEGARKEFPSDVTLLGAVAAFYTRSNRVPALHVLLDRAAGDARRALATGRFDVSLFAMLGAVAKLRDRTQAARIAEATVAAIEGRPSDLGGAEQRASDPKLDDLLAPELLTPAFRALLNKTGEILDAASPVDLKGLRAVPMPQPPPPAGTEIRELGASFGLLNLEVFVSPTLGAVCMPVGSHPPQIVIGQSLMASGDDGVRHFLVRRALKAVQARASALSRSAPIDLLPLISAYLLLFAADWQPSAVDPGKLREVHGRLLKVKPKRIDDDVGMLALEVIGSLGNRASTLHTVVNGWGNRVALLACGDLSLAFNAIARAAGHAAGPATSGPERVTWINRNAEARDLAVFSVSDAHAEVRSKLGI